MKFPFVFPFLLAGATLPTGGSFPTEILGDAVEITEALATPSPLAGTEMGTLLGFASTPVASSVTGILIETYFYEGQIVRKGQLLAKLWIRNTNSQAYVNAPTKGVVSNIKTQIREVWPAGKPLLTLLDVTQLEVQLRLSPTGRRFHLHDSMRLWLPSRPLALIAGKIAQIKPSDASSGKLTVRVAHALTGATVGSAVMIGTTQKASIQSAYLKRAR